MRTKNLGRCDYCDRAATVRFAYLGYLSSTRQRWWKVYVRACAEHEGCVNWNDHRARHPDAPLERRDA